MIDSDGVDRDLAVLVVPSVGRLVETGDAWEPYQLIDPAGSVVDAVAVYFKDLLAAGNPPTTLRSYGMDLLRWFRFLWAVQIDWSRATRVEARDFSRWLQLVDKPIRGRRRNGAAAAGVPNPVTGKPTPGAKYAASVRAHSETVLRNFYELHREMGCGPILNPFPLVRDRRASRVNAHHNPMEPWRKERKGLYRPKVAKRVPRSIPDDLFNELFAALPSNRDRALVAFAVSSGARAAELLGVTQGGVDPGQQLITVVRKGTRAVQRLPASTDAFVWLRLYQQQMHGLIPLGRAQPLWWTLRRPYRPLNYHAALAVLRRTQALLGSNVTWHDFRHSAAYRMARDPQMPLTDVQWVLGHGHLSTTQLYLTPTEDDVIASVLAHHDRHAKRAIEQPTPLPAPAYRPESLDILFGPGKS
jgi:site-specific recombinase XerC